LILEEPKIALHLYPCVFHHPVILDDGEVIDYGYLALHQLGLIEFLHDLLSFQLLLHKIEVFVLGGDSVGQAKQVILLDLLFVF